jgi:hypothetical protein
MGPPASAASSAPSPTSVQVNVDPRVELFAIIYRFLPHAGDGLGLAPGQVYPEDARGLPDRRRGEDGSAIRCPGKPLAAIPPLACDLGNLSPLHRLPPNPGGSR